MRLAAGIVDNGLRSRSGLALMLSNEHQACISHTVNDRWKNVLETSRLYLDSRLVQKQFWAALSKLIGVECVLSRKIEMQIW